MDIQGNRDHLIISMRSQEPTWIPHRIYNDELSLFKNNDYEPGKWKMLILDFLVRKYKHYEDYRSLIIEYNSWTIQFELCKKLIIGGNSRPNTLVWDEFQITRGYQLKVKASQTDQWHLNYSSLVIISICWKHFYISMLLTIWPLIVLIAISKGPLWHLI